MPLPMSQNDSRSAEDRDIIPVRFRRPLFPHANNTTHSNISNDIEAGSGSDGGGISIGGGGISIGVDGLDGNGNPDTSGGSGRSAASASENGNGSNGDTSSTDVAVTSSSSVRPSTSGDSSGR